MMAVALGEASSEVIARVKAHLPTCDYCMACFAVYEKVARNEDTPEPDLTESMWNEMASGPDDLVVEEPQEVGENMSTSTGHDTSVNSITRWNYIDFVNRMKGFSNQAESLLKRSPSYIERVRRGEPDAVMEELTDVAEFLLRDFGMGEEYKDLFLHVVRADLESGKPIDMWAKMPLWLTKTWNIGHGNT